MRYAVLLFLVVLVGCSVEGTRAGPDGEAVPFKASLGEYSEAPRTPAVWVINDTTLAAGDACVLIDYADKTVTVYGEGGLGTIVDAPCLPDSGWPSD